MLKTETVWSGVAGAPYYTALYFLGESEEQAESAHAATVELWQAIVAYYRADMTATVQPEVSVVDPATGLTTATFLEASVPVVGSGSPPYQPLVIQGLLRLRTGTYVGGREIRGKIFLPGTGDSQDNNGVPAADYQGTITTLFNAFLADTLALGIPLQVWSRAGGVSASVQAGSVWNQWAILRSRRD